MKNDLTPVVTLDMAEYGTWKWYHNFCHTMAEAEYEAHSEKHKDYVGPGTDNIFWMFNDIQAETGLNFNQVWMAWATRHMNALLRALQSDNPAVAGKRALDLMGWLFLLLAYYKPTNDSK
jgi:hypothetical protein